MSFISLVKIVLIRPLTSRFPVLWKGLFIFREIGGGQSVPYHHISPARQNMIHHAPGIFSRIGVIPSTIR